jgi:hypothetical protein
MKSPGSCHELCGYWEPDSLWKLLGACGSSWGPVKAPVEALVKAPRGLWKLPYSCWELLRPLEAAKSILSRF